MLDDYLKFIIRNEYDTLYMLEHFMNAITDRREAGMNDSMILGMILSELFDRYKTTCECIETHEMMKNKRRK